ncbi:hypothetical protein [Streptomyces sp. NPDC055243]|uniref:hypothetical protein n=1 Tax=Streptomyces sp. NPDC055243 TaxID=3365720 RepID=UPI0037D16353
MPSKRRAKQDAEAMAQPDKCHLPAHVAGPTTTLLRGDGMGGATGGGAGARRVEVSFPAPRSTIISGGSAVTGGTGLTVAIATGNVEPVYVWPCIVLIALGMAYDLGRRVIDRWKNDKDSRQAAPANR